MSHIRKSIAALALGLTTAALGSTATAATGGVQTRAQIPWTSVTKGWTVAEVAKNGHTNLVMVSPAGQSYQIATIDGSHLMSVSPDGKRALLYGEAGGLRTFDLVAGRNLATVPDMDSVAFTRPSGLGLVGTNAKRALVNRSATTGALTKQGATLPSAPWGVLPSPSGTTDVVSTGTSIKLYDHATLQPTRTYAVPTGYTNCELQGFVGTTAFREVCVEKASLNKAEWAATTQVFTQNVNGGAPTPVTSGTYSGGTSAGLPLGFSGAWETSKGTIAAPNVADFTGSTRVFRVANGRIAQTYSVPMASDAAKMQPIVKTMVGTRAYFTSNLHEAGPMIALTYDVATNSVTYLTGAHSQYGGTTMNYSVIE